MSHRHTTQFRSRRNRQAFTLMEVLLVLSILVILGGTVSFFFIRVQKNAQSDAARTQINAYKSALDIYRMDVGMYPTEGLTALKAAPSNLPPNVSWRGPYIEKEIVADPWGTPYEYSLQKNNETGEMAVTIVSAGPDRTLNTDDDISGT